MRSQVTFELDLWKKIKNSYIQVGALTNLSHLLAPFLFDIFNLCSERDVAFECLFQYRIYKATIYYGLNVVNNKLLWVQNMLKENS